MSESTATITWEDFEVGRTVQLGQKRVLKEEVIEYACEFDPQPMHMDEMAAKETMFGGLIASGWHTCSMLMRMICDAYLLDSTSLGSPGLDEINFLAPVKPGDTLRAQYTCLESRSSGSRPDIGIVKVLYELFNQDNQLVLTWRCNQFFGRREPGAAE